MCIWTHIYVIDYKTYIANNEYRWYSSQKNTIYFTLLLYKHTLKWNMGQFGYVHWSMLWAQSDQIRFLLCWRSINSSAIISKSNESFTCYSFTCHIECCVHLTQGGSWAICFYMWFHLISMLIRSITQNAMDKKFGIRQFPSPEHPHIALPQNILQYSTYRVTTGEIGPQSRLLCRPSRKLPFSRTLCGG